MLHVLYLVHDLCDPATARRVAMLQAGGAHVTLAGFRRGALPTFDGIAPIDLGMTGDRAFAQRLIAVGKAAIMLGARLKGLMKPDIVVARNLEMLALANRVHALFGANVPIVYECLDIHRLLLDEGAVGKAMRGAERFLGRNAALLVTSSPAFVREYFEARGQSHAPVMLLENKVLELSGGAGQPMRAASPPAEGEAWRIGWFGALRCARSLALLAAFTRATQGRFEVVLRGRPAHVEFDDFDGFVAAEPHMRFEGPYRNPQDLPAIYGEVHFSWAIDFFEAGMNSDWLLPNRLYEGCRFGAVPLAMQSTETGRFLAGHGIGLLLDRPEAEPLTALLEDMTAGRYAALSEAVAVHKPETWVCDAAECRALVERMKGVAASAWARTPVEAAA